MKILSTVMPKKGGDRTSPTVINYQGKTHTKPDEIADALNDFYITIGRKTSQGIPKKKTKVVQEERNPKVPFTLRHITTDELTKTMNKLNRNKASDIFKIKPTILRDLTQTTLRLSYANFSTPLSTNTATQTHSRSRK